MAGVLVEHGRRRLTARFVLAGVLAAAVLFIGYFRMARGIGTNADGAANALQSWDMVHGNPLLHGWVVSDVSFYTVELVQMAIIETLVGLDANVLMASAALSYTLIVVLVALLARGRTAGALGWARAAVATAFVVVPQPGLGQVILLNQPDHTGSTVPLLLTWLVLDRATTDADGQSREPGRWLPYAVAGLLAWGQLSDPLLTLIGAAPLVLIGLYRLARARRWRPHRWRCLDGSLVLAGAASVILADLIEWLITLAGGYATQKVPTEISSLNELREHLWRTVDAIAVLFGAYFPDLHSGLDRTLGVVHLVGLALVAGAVVVTVLRSVLGRGDRLGEILVLAITINIAAFVVSALNSDLLASREIAPVLGMAAALTARVWVRLPSRGRSVGVGVRRIMALAAVSITVLLATAFVGQATVTPVKPAGTALAAWLTAEHLHYGLGSYWTANTVSMDSGDTVRVAPTTSRDDRIEAYAWESRRDWYDPARHDARFIVIDLNAPLFGTVEQAVAQFGEPTRRATVATIPGRSATVLVYDHNLLVGLPAWCTAARSAPAMSAC